MATNLSTLPLEKCLDALIDYRGKTPKKVSSGIPLITAKVVKSGRIERPDEFIAEEDYEAWMTRGHPEIGDVVLTTEAPLGEVAQIKFLPVALAQRIVTLRGKKGVLDSGYLLYLLQSAHMQEKLVGRSSGTTVLGIKQSELRKVEVSLPPIEEQRAIARILGTLDDKIDLNRKQNETMDAMARALFKAWFVDFEPVRAKVDGRWQRGQSLLGLPAHLYDLFPDRLVDSELGDIPEGWDEGSFGRIVSQRSVRVGSREVTVLSAVASGKLARSDEHFTKRVYSQDTGKYLLVEQWDFAYNPSRINIGSIGMLEEDIVGGVSPVYVVARPKRSYQWFLEFSIRRPHTKTWINILASGSVRQSLSYADFASIPCIIPPETITQEFNRRWSALREGIRSREAESRSLAQLRDTLLPKLISGELRIPDAERIVGVAV